MHGIEIWLDENFYIIKIEAYFDILFRVLMSPELLVDL
jgi:hypothetical protein